MPIKRRWFQFHLLTAVVAMIVAGGMMWLNIGPAKKYSVQPDGAHYDGPPRIDLLRAVGWPVHAGFYPPFEGILSDAFDESSFGDFPDPPLELTATDTAVPPTLDIGVAFVECVRAPKFTWSSLLLDTAIAIAVLASVALLFELVLRRRISAVHSMDLIPASADSV